MFQEAGGSIGCTSASNRTQIYNAHKPTDSKGKDPILEQLRYHKLLGSEWCVKSDFAISHCVVTLDKQLKDIEKFRTKKYAVADNPPPPLPWVGVDPGVEGSALVN